MALNRVIAPVVSDATMARIMVTKPGDFMYPIRQYEEDVANGVITFDAEGFAVDNQGDRWLNQNLIDHVSAFDLNVEVI